MVATEEKPITRVGRAPPKPNRDLERIMAEFSDRQLALIMSNVGAVQLTEGCSVACPFCFIDAKPFVREYIPFDILEFIATNFGARFPKGAFLYYASDPFDYDFERHDYVDVHELFQDAMGYSPYVSTAVPKGKEDQVIRLLLMDTKPRSRLHSPILSRIGNLIWDKITGQQWVEGRDLDSRVISRISVSYMNHKRLESAFLRHFPNLDPSKQHLGEYEIGQPDVTTFRGVKHIGGYALNFGFPEDFGKPLEEQMSALYEKLGIQDSQHLLSGFFAVPMIRYIPLSYFIEMYHKPKKDKGKVYFMDMGDGRFIYALDRPVTFTDIIATFENAVHPPLIFRDRLDIDDATINGGEILRNLGKRNLDNLSDTSPSCFHGVVIKPDGFYNVEKVTPSRQYPTGYREERIDPKSFRVAKYAYIDDDSNLSFNPHKILTLPPFYTRFIPQGIRNFLGSGNHK